MTGAIRVPGRGPDALKVIWPAVFFIAMLVLGLKTYSAYGVAWDDHISREHGHQVWDFLFKGDRALLANPERHHGPFIEFVLTWIEKLIGTGTWREGTLVRHAATHLIFLAGVVMFYRLGLRYFGDRRAALAGCVLLTFTPVIYANSFYNSKDIGFMALFIAAILTLERYRSGPSVVRAAVHAAMTAACIATRMPGTLIVVFTVIVEALRIPAAADRKSRTALLVFYLTLTACLTLLFWPALWSDPAGEFLIAAGQALKYPFGPETIVFEGRPLSPSDLPRRYLIASIVTTLPVAYLFLLSLGLAAGVWRVTRPGSPAETDRGADIVTLLWVGLPLLHFMIKPTHVYDGWRHYFFLYPGIVVWMVRGWGLIRRALLGRRVISVAAAVLILAEPVHFMVRAHPNAHAYYNLLAGPKEDLPGLYTVDHWGLSYRQALEHILRHDPRDRITVGLYNQSGYFNYLFLKPEDRERIILVDGEASADYRLTNYRKGASWKWPDTEMEKNYILEKHIDADGIRMTGIYRNRRDDRRGGGS